MTPLITFLPDRDVVMVGDVPIPARPLPGGGLAIDGTVVRPLTLGERDIILALAGGPGRVAQLAWLVGATAAEGDPRDDDHRAAIEAVALHLSGASMAGSLIRTTMLATRALGPAATSMAAVAADRIAQSLADVLSVPDTPGDGGWTTISYASHNAPDVNGVAEVRDALAALLVSRGELPLDRDTAASITGGEGGSPGPLEAHHPSPPLTPAIPDRRTPGDEPASPGDASRSPENPGRWSATVVPPRTEAAAATATSRVGPVARPDQGRWSAAGTTDDHGGRPRQVLGRPIPSSETPSPDTAERFAPGPAAPTPTGAEQIRPLTVAYDAEPGSAGTTRAEGLDSGPPRPVERTVAMDPSAPRMHAGSRWHAPPWFSRSALRGGPRAPEPGVDRRTGTHPGEDLESLARDLHRVADLRGVGR